jgi:hypothetical protein
VRRTCLVVKYHFNMIDATVDHDETGQEFATGGDARNEAIRFAGEVIRDRPDIVRTDKDFRVEVINEEGFPLFTIIIVAVDHPEQQFTVHQ